MDHRSFAPGRGPDTEGGGADNRRTDALDKGHTPVLDRTGLIHLCDPKWRPLWKYEVYEQTDE